MTTWDEKYKAHRANIKTPGLDEYFPASTDDADAMPFSYGDLFGELLTTKALAEALAVSMADVIAMRRQMLAEYHVRIDSQESLASQVHDISTDLASLVENVEKVASAIGTLVDVTVATA